mgnify:CR=1 FL=1
MPRKGRKPPGERKTLPDQYPTRHKTKLKLPSGKTITLKQKYAHDKGAMDLELREQFLTLIREGFTQKDAAHACGCGVQFFTKRRKIWPEFEKDFQEAKAEGDDIVRAEIHRRGVDGVKRAIYHDGKVVGYKREYSDQLLMFLAKSRMPEEFGQRQTVDHNIKLDGAASKLVDKMADMLGVQPPDEPPRNPSFIDITPGEVDD